MMSTLRTRVRVAAALAATAAFGLTRVASQAETLPRDHITLPEVVSLDISAGTVTLPLYHGRAKARDVYYIVTDASRKAEAQKLGANLAPSITGAFTQRARGAATALSFAGAPDFSATRIYTPGTTGFPPKAAQPGAVGDAKYSPFVKLDDGAVLDAPIVATGTAEDVTTHTDTSDRVVAISADRKTVTLLLAHGFFNGSDVVYLSTEASDPGVASIERATYVKGLNASKPASEAGIVALANGQTGADNAQAQGLAHLALDGNLEHDATAANVARDGSPRNILATFNAGPSAAAYTPLWNASVGAWSKAAVAAHSNEQLRSLSAVYDAAAKGTITSPDGKAFGPSGFVVNCSVVGYVDRAPY